MTFAYLRISTDKQNLLNQKEEILKFASSHKITVDRWVHEIISGKISSRNRKLGSILKHLQAGDTLIVTEISRLSRSLAEIMGIMSACLKKSVKVYSIKEGYSFDDSINSQVICFAFGLAADIERRMISMRTKEALAMRRAQGVKLGRPVGIAPKLSMLESCHNHILKSIEEFETISSMSKKFGVSRSTLLRFIERNEDLHAALEARVLRTHD